MHVEIKLQNLKPLPWNYCCCFGGWGFEGMPYYILTAIFSFHLDHASALPYVLAKTGFKGRVFMTHPTKAIYKWLIQDSVRVQYGLLVRFEDQILIMAQKPILIIRPKNAVIYRSRSSLHFPPNRSYRLSYNPYHFIDSHHPLSCRTCSRSCHVFD